MIALKRKIVNPPSIINGGGGAVPFMKQRSNLKPTQKAWNDVQKRAFSDNGELNTYTFSFLFFTIFHFSTKEFLKPVFLKPVFFPNVIQNPSG